MKAYWRFFREETSLLTYGLSLTLLSSVGQTFLVSLFVPHFLADFSLSGAGFGTLYSVATLSGALLLPWTGSRLDRIPLQRFTLAVVAGLALSACLVAGAWNLAALGVGLVGIRLSGQGLSAHTAMTAMARYYERARGRAIGISTLGYPLGEATLPLLITASIALVGWRMTWVGLAVAAGFVFGPLLIWLLRRAEVELDPRRLSGADGSGDGPSGRAGHAGAPDTLDRDPTREPEADPADADPRSDWSRREVLGDLRFWSVLPAALLPAFWGTGLFLYQTSIADLKGWTVGLMASAFVAFAVSRVFFGLLFGGGVDRLSSRRLFPFCLLPLGGAMALLVVLDAVWVPFGFMALLGVTMGASGSLKTPLWAELYGVRHLGAIRSMMASLTVLSTAAAPAIVGFALEDAGSLDALLVAGIASVVGATVLALKVFPRGREGRRAAA